MQQTVDLIPISPPPTERRARRNAQSAAEGERRTRYTLPSQLESSSPVGYRTRIRLSKEEAKQAATLLSLERPKAFVASTPPTEQALFEECSLGILSSRQSTNFRGHRQVTLGPEDSQALAAELRQLSDLEAPVLDHATHTHVVLSRPYRTPFTFLLTFVGHLPLLSLLTVPIRSFRKKTQHIDDIPTIGFLPTLHLGILADGMERAAILASAGRQQANILLGPFSCAKRQRANQAIIQRIAKRIGLTAAERRQGWRIRLVAQVGTTAQPIDLPPDLCRKVAANLLAFRSERIQPGVNAEEKAPPQYQERQGMSVPDELAFMAARAAYNAFEHWTGCERDAAKELLLMERVDVLTPGGKERLRDIRREQNEITDRLIARMPLWADLPLGRLLSKNANRGRKAFALAGQRIYIGGLDKEQCEQAEIEWNHAITAFGAAAARSALACELSGLIELPDDCDLLSGMCLMAGPVNQNDIGKQFFGYPDLLAKEWPNRNPTALLLWTLKAKTVADPIGNEEQLMSQERKGALVDLRCGPHEVIGIRRTQQIEPMRSRNGRISQERAFADQNNFVTDPTGDEIPGNRGEAWPTEWSSQPVWSPPGSTS